MLIQQHFEVFFHQKPNLGTSGSVHGCLHRDVNIQHIGIRHNIGIDGDPVHTSPFEE